MAPARPLVLETAFENGSPASSGVVAEAAGRPDTLVPDTDMATVSKIFGGADVTGVGQTLAMALVAHATHRCLPRSRCAARTATPADMRKLKQLAKRHPSPAAETLVREVNSCRTAFSGI